MCLNYLDVLRQVYFFTAERLRNFTLSVCGQFYQNSSVWADCEVCFEQVEALAAWESKTFHCDHMIHGRYVLVRLNTKGILTLCKVRIFGSQIRGENPNGM